MNWNLGVSIRLSVVRFVRSPCPSHYIALAWGTNTTNYTPKKLHFRLRFG